MKFDQLSGIVLKWAKEYRLKDVDQFIADLKSDWDAYNEMDEKEKVRWVSKDFANKPLEYLFLRHLKANTIDHFALERYVKSTFSEKFDSIEIFDKKYTKLLDLSKEANPHEFHAEHYFYALASVLLGQDYYPKHWENG